MNSRLVQLRKALGMNQHDFSKSIAIGQSTLAMIESGKRTLNERHIKLICSTHNINEEWLRTGEGEMFNFIEDEVAAIVSDMLENGDQDPFYQLILSTVRIYQKYDDKGKEVFKSFAIQLIEEMKKRDD